MKTVLLYIDDDTGLDARLQAALDLTRAVNGHLHCLRSNPFQPQMIFGGITGMSVIQEAAQLTHQTDVALRDRIEKQLAGEDVSWTYHQVNAHPANGLARNSALSDVIVLSSMSGNKANTDALGLLGDVIFNTRLPVVVQPDSVKKFDATGPAVVAWNGSFEAGNALRAAVPLLKLASDVHILTVEEEKDHDLPPLDASEYLSQHDIKSKVHSPDAGKSSVQASLLASVDALGASYIVMGAYGQSRARQFLFGGVTRSLFRDCPVPLVVSH